MNERDDVCLLVTRESVVTTCLGTSTAVLKGLALAFIFLFAIGVKHVEQENRGREISYARD